MIASFKDKETQHLFETGEHRKLGDTVRSAVRKLRILHATTKLESLRQPSWNLCEYPPGTGLKPCAEIGRGSSVSASMTAGVSASHGKTETRMMSK